MSRTADQQAARERADQLRSVAVWNTRRKQRADALASVVHHLGAALAAAPAGCSASMLSSAEYALESARGNLRAVLNEPNPFV